MRILFLQKRLLFPHNTGGKIRTLNVLRHLAERHQITYVCNVQRSESQYAEQMKSLGTRLITVPWQEASRRSIKFAAFALRNLLYSRYPLNVDKDFDPRLRKLVENEVESGNYDLLVCDFVQTSRNCIQIEIPKLLFQHNVEAEIFERLAKRNCGLFGRYLSAQACRMRQFESEAGRDFDGVVAVSRRDSERFQSDYGWNHVGVIDTAVDTDYFRRVNDIRQRTSMQRSGIVFVGSMDWPPNVDGVAHFVKYIWPRIRDACNDATFTIVGRNPPASILRLQNTDKISVTGTVDDTRPFLSNSAVSIVPLYSGGGTRLKIFEYMAMECPVVSTTLGAEGLDVRDGQHLLIRDDDIAFADAISELINNPERRKSLSRRAHALVKTRYSAEKVAMQFERHCWDAIERYARTERTRSQTISPSPEADRE